MLQRMAAIGLGLAAAACSLPDDGADAELVVSQTTGNMCEGYDLYPRFGWGQSFTAPRSGELLRFDLGVLELGRPFWIAVYEGDGFAGAQLFEMRTVVNYDGVADTYFGIYDLSRSVPVVAGQTYTIGVARDTDVSGGWCSIHGDPYPGGIAYRGGVALPTDDAVFAVYMDR